MGQQSGKDAKPKLGGVVSTPQQRTAAAQGRPHSAPVPATGTGQQVRSNRVNDILLSPSVTSGSKLGNEGANNSSFHSHGSGSCSPVDTKRGVTAAGRRNPSTQCFPIVLRYQDKDAAELATRKACVTVLVEALDWRPLPMSASEDTFFTVAELPPGPHRYRFCVDGHEVVDSTQPHEKGKEDGLLANTILLNDVLLTTKEDDDPMDDGAGWGQEAVMFEESRKYPPILPVHLRYTPLNTPPTLVRCATDGTLNVHDNSLMAPEHLPLPLSVTINHVYFQRREEHAVMGVTTRYCNKFTTVVYYKHMPPPVDA